jgi:mannosyltransferase
MVAALLLAISPFHVWYSQEARQYILLASLTTAATNELWECLQGRRRWVLYSIYAALSLYTQYFSVFVLLAHAGIAVLWAWKRQSWRSLLAWMGSLVGAGITFIPWLPTALDQFQYHGMPWISDPRAGDVADVALRLLLGSGVLELPAWMRWTGVGFLFAVGGWMTLRLWGREWATWQGLGFLGIWALVPFSAMSLAAIVYPVFQFKQYLISLAPFLMTAVGGGMALPRIWNRLFVTGLILANLFTLGYQQTVLSKDDWRGAATHIQAEYQACDLVYGNPAASALALELYWPEAFQFAGYPPGYHILQGGWAGQPLTPALADQQLSKLAQKYCRVWLVEYFPQFWDAEKILESWLAGHGILQADSAFGKIRLRLYDLEP